MDWWIKLHRKILDNPISHSIELFAMMSYMLLKANHTDTTIYLWLNKIDIKAWQFVSSQRKIADHFWLPISKVHRIIKALWDEWILKHEWNTKYTIFTILNWDIYQWDETQVKHKWNTNETKKETNNNNNNKNNNKNILSKDNINIDKSISEQSSGLFDEPVEEFWKPDINLLIKELKDFCNKNWISYDKEDERKFWKHIMTAKEYWEFCKSIKQDRIQFALNVLKASIKINYWKWVCSWPKKIYQNYSEVYNQTKLKNYKNTNYILPWID